MRNLETIVEQLQRKIAALEKRVGSQMGSISDLEKRVQGVERRISGQHAANISSPNPPRRQNQRKF
jgi:predicted RNase H-like nuclease (RuvC/YqgF family)